MEKGSYVGMGTWINDAATLLSFDMEYMSKSSEIYLSWIHMYMCISQMCAFEQTAVCNLCGGFIYVVILL